MSTKLYIVLARGFHPFETDSLKEALEDASSKASYSFHVTVLDIYDRVVIEYKNYKLLFPFYGLKQLEE